MSNKDELVLWVQGVEAYKRGDLEGALAAFEPILSLSKVAFNAGMIYTRFNDHASADTMYSAALAADPYLAVAFLQKAYAYFVLQDYSRAERCYNMIVELLLENDYIDYTQLGLKYRLYRCEVFFNRAMCAQLRGDDARALQDITAAQRCARTPDHNAVIGTAARAGVDDITLFTVPFEAVFEVPEAKQKNLDRRNYLKDARIVASNETETDAFAGFSGAAIIDPSLADEAAAQGKNATLGPSSPFPDQRKLGPAAGIARSNTSSSGGSAGRVPTATAKPAPPGMTKVKVHFDGRTFGMLVPSDIRLTAFSDMIRSKQGLSQAPQISYPDEEDPDTMISVADDDDLALAIDSASGATVHFYCRAAGDLLDYY
ncbi:hypothetical protein HK105_208782 [Polyrhizophydium stewartii]|uniref:PB1 domain-containing protein n=1 Tax=Polyrhizophydium stewartii TaxID=2732419 RepID=A0ABR4MWV1_9FUNG